MQPEDYLNNIPLPEPSSHKGQNGKLLVIGGSRLFHSSVFWSAQVASKFVDIVHFSSPANENNNLVRYQLKQGFWQGIVVDFSQVETYIREDDVVLIGPGMERTKETEDLVNSLLRKFPKKKWVIDGGALQMVDVSLLGPGHIITPHKKELERLVIRHSENLPAVASRQLMQAGSSVARGVQNLDGKSRKWEVGSKKRSENFKLITKLTTRGVTILYKNVVDTVYARDRKIIIEGGNAGLTKGGSGDILAGLTAAFYTQADAVSAAVAASYVLKKSADVLWQEVGPNFNAEDLIRQIPKTFWQLRLKKL